jgi:hypothetical protein
MPSREIARARRLDDQVGVVALNRVVDEAEAAAVARRSEAEFELADEAHGAQRRDLGADLQRDVAGKARGQSCASAMRIARFRAALAPCPLAPPTPTRRGAKIECELSRSTRHDRQDDQSLCQIRTHLMAP